MLLSPSRTWLRVLLVLTCCGGLLGLAGAWHAEIKSDEVVVLFPTFGVREAAGWKLEIHGIIYEPELDSRIRRDGLEAFARLVGLKPEDAATPIFEARARRFLVDNEGGKRLSIRLGERDYDAGESGANGHFRQTLHISLAEANRLTEGQAASLAFHAVTSKQDVRRFTGRLRLIEPEGLSIVSDIDDTIKISEVRDKRALLSRTFLQEFEPIPGMAELYRTWDRRGAAIHYVSGSPWQLYEPLEAFRKQHGFPAGTFHLRQFRLKDRSALKLMASPEEYKPPAIEALLQAFPKRRFMCVGDSGEKDPEVYGELARKHPQQIVRILIRDVTSEPAEVERYRQAFKDVPRAKWQVFKEPSEVQP
jgi:phosphatidate phosphatase APP1